MKRLFTCAQLLLTTLLITACAQKPFPSIDRSLELQNKNPISSNSQTTSVDNNSLSTTFEKTPEPQKQKKNALVEMTNDGLVFKGSDLVVSAENMSLPAFVNEVFGNLLGVNFVLDPKLQKQSDRVTLRVTEPQTPEQLYNLTLRVLETYGIEVVHEGEILRITVANNSGSLSSPPLLVSGSTLPNVPLSHRPIFQMVQLKTVRSSQIIGWLTNVYNGTKLKIQNDQQRNAIILIGSAEVVTEAIRAIEFFDTPFMRGKQSVKISPAFISARELASLLVNVLTAQGYGAGLNVSASGSILVIPITQSNTVLLFATDQKALQHAKEWAITLDKPNLQAGKDSLFFYPVANTRADSIAQTLNDLLSGSSDATISQQGNGAQAMQNAGQSKSRILVDEDRNALLFRGEPAEWERMMTLIKQMDVPAKQVLIEVTIAEVNLTESQTFGVEWFAKGMNGRFSSKFNSSPNSGVGGLGMNWVLDVAGETAAVLNAFANDSRVNVLSTPRILVKTGTEASLNVVTEIPTVTGRRNTNDTTNGSSDVIEEVVYRKTGIVLSIKPIVHAGNRVDLDISQEVSEALPLTAGGTSDSPAIFTRDVKTSLSLHSGGSVFLAGLISTRDTNSDGGIPMLKDIPIIGNLFKATTKERTRTELVIMIVPYILNDENDAASITDSLIQGLELIK